MSINYPDMETYAALPDELFMIDANVNDAEAILRPSISYWQDVWQRFRKDPLALVGLFIILIMTLMAVFMPMVSPYTYSGMDLLSMNQGPSLAHPCGTDQMGRDLFIRIMYGARISLTIGIIAAVINFLIGVLYGGLSGYLGGRADMVMMRIVDILSSLPSLLYIVLIMLIFGSNVGSVILALCFTSWIGTARVVRSEVMHLKHSDYVLAGRLAGASTWHLLIQHLIPNAIFSESFLSFLGIGIQAPHASWGSLANDAIPMMLSAPYQIFFPVLAICITMLSFNFIGDGLRDALDPRLKK